MASVYYKDDTGMDLAGLPALKPNVDFDFEEHLPHTELELHSGLSENEASEETIYPSNIFIV